MNQGGKPPLNAGQQAAADGFFASLFDKDVTEINISGPGGTGKSFLVADLIDRVLQEYYDTCKLMGIPAEYDGVVLTAMTNKAAEVLAQATGREVQTIHSFLGLKVMDDFSTGRQKLIKTPLWKVHQNKIIFIDEISMQDTVLDNFLKEATHNCKLVYVGDICQLAPVMEKIAPVYKRAMPFFELTEPMRTDIPQLQTLNNQLRTTVQTGVFKPIQIVPGIIDWVDDAGLIRELDTHFQGQSSEQRILAYTNQRVLQFNDHLRTMRALGDAFQVGEKLVNNTAIKINNQMLSVEAEVEIVYLDEDSTFDWVDSDCKLEYRIGTLLGRNGISYYGARIPVDREHFHALQKYFKGKKAWAEFFHLKNNYVDLRQFDASTGHKAQGSSHTQVYVDAGNLSTCRDADTVARLLYVCASRCRKRVVFYGQLAEKYGGFIF